MAKLTNNKGQTALHKAALKGHNDIAKLIASSSPEAIGIKDKAGKTAADHAVERDNSELVKILHEARQAL